MESRENKALRVLKDTKIMLTESTRIDGIAEILRLKGYSSLVCQINWSDSAMVAASQIISLLTARGDFNLIKAVLKLALKCETVEEIKISLQEVINEYPPYDNDIEID